MVLRLARPVRWLRTWLTTGMSHGDQIEFFRIASERLPHFFTGTRVLEVGSLDINGSIRHLTKSCQYVGIDIGVGPGVDLVVAGQDYDAPGESFDLVLSGECMEHNPAWEETTVNMIRMLRPGGLFVLSCAAPGRLEHGTTRSSPAASPLTVAAGQDYYQNLEYRDFKKARVLTELTTHQHWLNWRTRDLYIAGTKGRMDDKAWRLYTAAIDAWLTEIERSRPVPGFQRAVLSLFGRRSYEAALGVIRMLKRTRYRVDKRND